MAKLETMYYELANSAYIVKNNVHTKHLGPHIVITSVVCISKCHMYVTLNCVQVKGLN